MKSYIIAILIVLAGLGIGVVIDIALIRMLKHLATRSRWKIYRVLSISMRKMFVVWSTLAAGEFSISYLSLGAKFEQLIHKGIIIIAVASVVVLFMKVLSRALQETEDKVLYGSSIIRFIINLFLFSIGVAIVLQIIGVSIAPMITTLGIGGIAVALALQDTLSNIFSGMYILSVKQIRPGDYIKMNTGEEGYVEDIGWRNTTVRMLSNNLIIVPNSKLASSIVVNYHLPVPEMSVVIQVGVSYESDLEKVERVTIEVAKSIQEEVIGGIKGFQPFIRYHTFGEFSIKFSVILRVKEFTDQYLIKHEFLKRLHKRYKEEGIIIPYPVTTVYLKGEAKGS